MHLALPVLALLPLVLSSPLSVRSCPEPTYFQINGFTTFTADPGPNGESFINFKLGEPVTNTYTNCGRTLPPGSGKSPADPDHYYSCDNAAVQFSWNGTALSLEETYADCDGLEKTASGTGAISTFCFEVPLPAPYGSGLECQTPAGVANVFVTSVETTYPDSVW